MVWLKDEPTTSTKISQLATIITNNWNGIQNGEVPFVNLRLTDTSDPTRNDNYSWLYAKDPGTSLFELFFEDNDNPANVIQLTSGGSIGSTTTSFLASDISFDTGATSLSFSASNMIVARSSVSSGGAASGNLNMTASRTTDGSYTLSVNADVLLNSSYQVLLTSFRSGTTDTIAEIITKAVPVAASPTLITVETHRRSNGDLIDVAFDVIIVGGR